MKNQITTLLICSVLVLTLAGCSAKYAAADFIGKTSAQIEAEFGAFDCCQMPISEDGLYRSVSCGYTIKKSQVGFLGTDPEWLVFIRFDENGIAYDTYEGYRPGG